MCGGAVREMYRTACEVAASVVEFDRTRFNKDFDVMVPDACTLDAAVRATTEALTGHDARLVREFDEGHSQS